MSNEFLFEFFQKINHDCFVQHWRILKRQIVEHHLIAKNIATYWSIVRCAVASRFSGKEINRYLTLMTIKLMVISTNWIKTMLKQPIGFFKTIYMCKLESFKENKNHQVLWDIGIKTIYSETLYPESPVGWNGAVEYTNCISAEE